MSDKTIELTKQELSTVKQLQLQNMRLEQRKLMIPVEREAIEAQFQNQLASLEVELAQIPDKIQGLIYQVANIMEIASKRSGDLVAG